MRQPPPLIPWRLPSGRGATEQPNVTGDRDAPLTLRFWMALILTAIATGLLGAGLMWVLKTFEHLAFGGGPGNFQDHVERTSSARRVLSLAIAGAFAGPAWFLIRRYLTSPHTEVDEALWAGDAKLAPLRSALSSIVSQIVIGLGASIGREAAPKLMGGVSGSVTSGWFGLCAAQRKLLVACGAGAGLACVYNVPLGGALFTAELLIGSVALPVVLPAVACSAGATVVAWVYLPNHAAYLGIPDFPFKASIMVWALIAGPIIGVVASGGIRLIGWVSHHRLKGRNLLAGPLVAFTVLGLVGIAYPQLFGNGKDMAFQAFTGHGAITLFLALGLLKLVMTSLCLGSGASGGLLTPFLSTGAVLGAFGGHLWVAMWPGSPLGAYALIGAAAMLGASIQAPLAGLVLAVELTHSGFQLMVPIMAATFLATAVARMIDGYSIYSARLPATDVVF